MCMTLDEFRDISRYEPRDTPASLWTHLSKKLANCRQMTTNGNTCESTLLNQISVKVLFDLLKGTQNF